jgi:hypothetical protein
MDLHERFLPCSLVDKFMRPPSPTTVTTMLDLCKDQVMESIMAQMPEALSILDSITHVVCSLRVCGIRGNDGPLVQIMRVTESMANGNLINGGSNVCVTSNLNILLDVVNITPIDILVALNGKSSSLDDKISKRGLLPLTLSDGTTYYQTCFYCANMVETIISPVAVLASSDILYYWSQEGCKDPSVPGRIRFQSKDGLLLMHFNLVQQDGLYYCDTDVFTVDRDPIRVCCHRAVTQDHGKPPQLVPTSRACQVESEVWLLRFGSPGEHQLNALPLNVVGMPATFEYPIPFAPLTLKSKLTFRNSRLGARQNVYLLVMLSSSWTLP